MSTLLEQQVTETLTTVLGRAPTAEEIRLGTLAPYPLSDIHNVATIGNSMLSINTTDDIQTALDKLNSNNGGILFLNPGTYTLTSDIYVPSGVLVEGAARDNVIIECGNFGIKMSGVNEYLDGTITINNGDTTVVGVATVWTANMIGRSIWLDNSWYEILDVADNTTITIDTYVGANLAGATYVLADIVLTLGLKNITVLNSIGAGIESKYSSEPTIDNVVINGCATGIYMNYVLFPIIRVTDSFNGVNLDMNNTNGFLIDFSEFSYSLSGNGMTMVTCTDATVFNSSMDSNFSNGIQMTDCSKIAFISFTLDSNGGNGIEFVSNCNDNQFSSGVFSNHTSNGVKLTASSNRNIFNSFTFLDNGAYGLDIAAASCNDNILGLSILSGNSSGAINDSGTGTLIRSNIGVADN